MLKAGTFRVYWTLSSLDVVWMNMSFYEQWEEIQAGTLVFLDLQKLTLSVAISNSLRSPFFEHQLAMLMPFIESNTTIFKILIFFSIFDWSCVFFQICPEKMINCDKPRQKPDEFGPGAPGVPARRLPRGDAGGGWQVPSKQGGMGCQEIQQYPSENEAIQIIRWEIAQTISW